VLIALGLVVSDGCLGHVAVHWLVTLCGVHDFSLVVGHCFQSDTEITELQAAVYI